MNEKDENPWGKVEPLKPGPQDILHTEEEDDDPTHTLFELLDKHICPLCGTEFYSGRLTSYQKKIYYLCENCGKMKEREIKKRFREIEKRKNDKK